MKKEILVTILVAAVVASGVAYFTSTKVQTIIRETIKEVGARSGPDDFSPFRCANGACEWSSSIIAATATTTVCALRSPVNATSTLDFASVDFSVGTTTAAIVTIAKATTAFATTTQIGTNYLLPASAQASIYSSTSPASPSAYFAPGQYLVVGMQGGGASTACSGGACTYSPTAKCKAVFRSTSD